jgi:hypothetical protein
VKSHPTSNHKSWLNMMSPNGPCMMHNQCINIHPFTVRITFATKSCFCNYQISTHYLPHVLNQGNFKTMILNVEKINVIKFKWLVMVPLGDTKMHHVALWGILGEFVFLIQILILAIHYEHSFKMILDYDMWHNQNLPCGILIIFWKKIKWIFIWISR